MKKSFKFYAISWALLLVVFNVIAIIAPGWPTLEKCTPSFWIGYAFITLAMIGQLICAWSVFKHDSAKKTFYNIPLFAVSYGGLVATFIVGLICMIISPLPYWVGAIVCPVILLITVIAVVKAKIAISVVESVDEKIETATAFVFDLREKSESLVARVDNEEIKTVCKKIADAFKFSDPMSSAGLSSIESEIKNHFDLFKVAVLDGNIESINAESKELFALIDERNNKCKRLK
jgi:hypothetical protein